MASSTQGQNEAGAREVDSENKKLHDIFLDGWNGYEELEVISLPFNSREFQVKYFTCCRLQQFANKFIFLFNICTPSS